jgi:site-specific recombinase XerD
VGERFWEITTDLKAATYLLRQDNGRRYTRKRAEQITHEWGARAKVRDCTPHRFRHTFGTRLLEQVHDLRVVQEALGHRDIKSTTVYTKVTSERLSSAIARLNWPSPGGTE